MRRVCIPLVVATLLGALLTAPLTTAGAQEACHPIQTEAEFRGTTPTAKQVLGFDIGSKEVTTAQSDRYLAAVDAASDRVVTGTAAVSQEGRALRYAIVGRPQNVTPAGLAQIRADAATLRDPQTSDATAATIVDRTPAILWVASNVHGGEESGTDASLRVLYELADREDCAADQILDNSLVVLLPIQNPDGREADTRRNHYGFDMNRDWFARTQPETDGKIELMRDYPPVMFIDDHGDCHTDRQDGRITYMNQIRDPERALRRIFASHTARLVAGLPDGDGRDLLLGFLTRYYRTRLAKHRQQARMGGFAWDVHE